MPFAIGQPAFFALLQPEGLQFASPAAAGFALALLEQHFELSPAAAGFALVLLEQHFELSPAAAGFAFAAAAAIGHSGVPWRAQLAAVLLHFEMSQFAGSQSAPPHCAVVALAFTFSVLLQPIIAKPSMATRVRVNSCFIDFSIKGIGGLQGRYLIVQESKVQNKAIF